MVLCQAPVNYISKIYVDDKVLDYTREKIAAFEELGKILIDGQTVTVDNEGLFGGDNSEGGIAGDLTVYTDGMDPVFGNPDPYLVEKLGDGNVPQYLGVVSVILKHMYLGTTGYLKNWKFLVTNVNTSDDWDYAYAAIGGEANIYEDRASVNADMNPIHVIRECLRSKRFGLGLPDGEIDDNTLNGTSSDYTDSFHVASRKIYDEGIGISALWDKESTVEDFIKEILRCIDAVVYIDRRSGKFKIRTIRDDYNVDDLLSITEDDIVSLNDYSKPTTGELINSVTVNYWDKETNTTGSITVQNIALSSLQGRTMDTKVQYPFITNKETAARLAQRDLRTLSTPTVKCTVVATEKAESLNIGDVFKLTYNDYGIFELPMRVVSISYGTPTDRSIRIQCVEDIFSTPKSAIVKPPDILWVDPNPTIRPDDVTVASVIDAPYWELVQNYGQLEVDRYLEANPELSLIMAFAKKPKNALLGQVYISDTDTTGPEYAGELDFAYSATITDRIDYLVEEVTLNIRDIDAAKIKTDEWGVIDNEIVFLTNLSKLDTDLWKATLKRGCLDTQPAIHDKDAVLFLPDENNYIHEKEYTTGEIVGVQIGASNLTSSTSELSRYNNWHTVDARAVLPYPPQNVKIDGSYYPEILQEYDTTVPLTWAHRNRVQQTGKYLLDFTSDTLADPEKGTTYIVSLRDMATDAVLFTKDVGGATTYSIDVDALTLASGRYSLVIESVRDGHVCMQPFKYDILIAVVSEPPATVAVGGTSDTPYYMWVSKSGKTNVDAIIDSNINIGAVIAYAKKPANATKIKLYIYNTTTSIDEYIGDTLATPVSLLSESVGYLDTIFKTSLSDAEAFAVNPGDLVFIDKEIVCIDGKTRIDADQWIVSVKRGCLDTQPSPHNSGSTLFFASISNIIHDDSYVKGTTVKSSIVSTNKLGDAPHGDWFVSNTLIQGRAGRPYPPQNVKINDIYYPPIETIFTSDINLTWAHRDRIAQLTGPMLSFTSDSLTSPETGVLYDVNVFTEDGSSVVYTSTNIDALLHTFTSSAMPSGTSTYKVSIASNRGGVVCLYPFEYKIQIKNGGTSPPSPSGPGVFIIGDTTGQVSCSDVHLVLGIKPPEPDVPPDPVAVASSIDIPYHIWVAKTSKSAVDAKVASNANVGAALVYARWPGNTTNVRIYNTVSGTDTLIGTMPTTAVGILNSDVGVSDTSIIIAIPDDEASSVAAETIMFAGSELIYVISKSKISTDVWSFTVKRGVLDSIPRKHLAGVVIYFGSDTGRINDSGFNAGDTVNSNLASVNRTTEATKPNWKLVTTSIDGRAGRPYPPQDIKIDGVSFPDQLKEYNADIAITWAHRDRIAQLSGTMLSYYDASLVSPEAGTTYSIELLDDSDVVVYTVSVGTNSHTIALASLPIVNATYTLRMYSTRGGLKSLYNQDYVVNVINAPIPMNATFIMGSTTDHVTCSSVTLKFN